ncbi:MAG: hypothetical protein A3D52_02450 [Candidatus Taylorbacteria bacterium RIFCSPHIGHO2_02_FULL_44_36]|uniref:Endolytic murein transglycosylase n=1 Tax=Candidatus Taylorbacteria bacterium RIFCSPLOWO2_12_FULL_44_15c TaxID=1802333 RepID=A0A1G2P9V3_9BACT|nr:MAG: hypothetical protein A3D52_02450 [Candidatus Taylorbacteria bacterium RIFCSPHIGHO2_02_FULL_44_36]OHA38542.1 MAG: hypothetical protein A3I97_00925 [Candidatus Taylorbacteria bacterium RIFCSPLOWO2_02_FULL_44_35]OHA44381.1 MAG: hypothetical protein A3G03_00700 [Candidatus Taylorbacteria bacterium RIFCSPLOWO2_12_FULL_44_15c]
MNFGKYFFNRHYFLAGFFILVVFSYFFVFLPIDFPLHTLVSVEKGVTIRKTADFLEQKNFISSAFWFVALSRMLSGGRGVLAGDYFFGRPQSLFTISRRLARGDFGLTPVVVFIPEGSSVKEIALILGKTLPSFDEEEFIKKAKDKEGYLFPDTYHFPQNIKPNAVIEAMEKNFNDKISTLNDKIAVLGKPLKEVVIMASLLEEEARKLETKQMIAGILWKRLKIGMPLQVDSSFQYVNGKNTFTLTLDDLKIDSPYNTYLHKGLPPTPITNPGLDSILAAVTPLASKYLYFLTDKNGNMRYAVTHDEHVANKEKYLR